MTKKFLKKTSLGVVLSVLGLLFFGTAMASTGIAVSLGNKAAAASQMISVPILAKTDAAISSMQFTLNYDPKLLSSPTVSLGAATKGWFVVSNPNKVGKFIVGMFTTGALAVSPSTDQEVAVVGFKVNDSAKNTSTPLTIDSIIFGKTKGVEGKSAVLTIN